MDYGIDPNEAQAGLAAAQPPQAPMQAPVAPPAPSLASAPQPAQPSQEAQVLDSSINFFRDPERLKLVAMAAAETGRTDVLAWLKRGHEAAQENTIDALGALTAGNTDRALQLFNATGQMKATGIEDAGNGQHKITFANGKSRVIDAKKEFYSFLTPPQMAAKEDREEATRARSEANAAAVAARLQVAGDNNATRTAISDGNQALRREIAAVAERQRDTQLGLNAQLTSARVDKLERGTGKGKGDSDAPDLSEKAQSKRVADITRQVNALRQYDAASKAETGEYDQAARMEIKARAIGIARKGVPADEAFEQAKEQFDGHKTKIAATIDDEVKGIRTKGEKSLLSPSTWGNSPDFGGHKNETAFRAAREKELMSGGGLRDAAEATNPTTAKQGQSPPTPARNDATKRPTSAPGATPKTPPGNPPPMATTSKPGQSPASASKPRYPDGMRLLHKDGQEYIMKNGLPVLVK